MCSFLEQRCFVVLAAIDDLGGSEKREAILKQIQAQGYLDLIDRDKEHNSSRRDPRWTTDVSYPVIKLRAEGYIYKAKAKENRRGHWKITDAGRAYLEQLGKRVEQTWNRAPHEMVVAWAAIERARDYL